MLKLIAGVKGTGKTKQLIELTNKALIDSHGSVVCLEQGTKLIHDIKHQIRLIDTSEYMICDGQSLFGFVSGIYASNYDITHIFIDSALKICKDDIASFEYFLKECEAFSARTKVDVIITASMPVENLTEAMKEYV